MFLRHDIFIAAVCLVNVLTEITQKFAWINVISVNLCEIDNTNLRIPEAEHSSRLPSSSLSQHHSQSTDFLPINNHNMMVNNMWKANKGSVELWFVLMYGSLRLFFILILRPADTPFRHLISIQFPVYIMEVWMSL